MDVRLGYDRINVIPSIYETLSTTASGTTVTYCILSLLLLGYICNHVNYPILPFSKFCWNAMVYSIPDSLVRALDKQSGVQTQHQDAGIIDLPRTQNFASKMEAMRRITGFGTSTLGNIASAKTLSVAGADAGATLKPPKSNNLPGLGNWDNSCYQNSIIQGLASLPALRGFLDQATSGVVYSTCQTTIQALKSVITDLNNPFNANKRLWTPDKLKNMSSWQQQDAQEYYSKVLNEMDKEAPHAITQNPGSLGLLEIKDLVLESSTDVLLSLKADPELGVILEAKQHDFARLPQELSLNMLKSPLEGLLAQRVGCLQCGFVEGLSMIPFNCLTVPLGREWTYDIRTCLNEYTALESIVGVDCPKCTLLDHKQQLENLLAKSKIKIGELDLLEVPKPSDSIRDLAISRLKAVSKALEEEDFSENTLLKKCLVPSTSRISTTKTRQAVIARHPKSLVMHVNRSVFDESTGKQWKNHAEVQFPKRLDLSPWCLGNLPLSDTSSFEFVPWTTDPSQSMIPDESCGQGNDEFGLIRVHYSLKAVVTHYGRHENGHYTCYRQRPHLGDEDEEFKDGDKWWCLSDDDVSEVTEDDVLAQGGVFMLFYELEEDCDRDLPASIPITNPFSFLINKPIESQQLSREAELTVLENTIKFLPTSFKADQEEPATQQILHPHPIPSPDLANSSETAPSLAATNPVYDRGSDPQDSNKGPHDIGLNSRITDIGEVSLTKTSSLSAGTEDTAEHSLTTDVSISAGSINIHSNDCAIKETRQLTPRMRTAGSWNKNNNVNRVGRAMSSVSSMVTAK
ncbi:hypothetical protein MMC14_000378 [Varicellaria rhodocarpa]|nr:hypothetical protein [Varicellaria rhodocarpa]